MNALTVFLVGILGGTVDFQTVTHLAPVPDDSDYFLQAPSSFDVNDAGDFFVLDVAAQVIFRWNASGEFQGVLGSPGQGPGEFSFFGRGGPQGFVQAVGEELWVLDGGKRQFLVFAGDGTLKESRDVRPSRSRITDFFVRHDGSVYLQIRKRNDTELVHEIVLMSPTGELLKTLESLDDHSITVQGTTRENRSITFRAYSPGLVSHYDRHAQILVWGNSAKPEFQVVRGDDETLQIKLPTIQREVTQEDKDEFNQQPFLSGRRRIQIEFCEKKPFYDQILPVSGKGFLVFTLSPWVRKAEGLLISENGIVAGRFIFVCGENGSLLGSQGRVLAVHLDEDDEFAIDEIVPASN